MYAIRSYYAHAFLALLKHDAPLLFPDITYSFYPVYCGLYGIDYRTVPLTESFEIDPAGYAGEAGAIIFRITSYNVCYTKLLRSPKREKGREDSRGSGGHSGLQGGVITSYSIHYTKLYER